MHSDRTAVYYFSFWGFGGITVADETHLAQSYATGWYYEQDVAWNTYGLYGVGISYAPNDNTYLQVDYDNRRGITFGIGWKF